MLAGARWAFQMSEMEHKQTCDAGLRCLILPQKRTSVRNRGFDQAVP
jgi:hypothetical protein